MPHESVLGYLVSNKLSQSAENLATEALAYILQRSSLAASALDHLLSECGLALREQLHFDTQASNADRSRPDLVGFDGDGNRRIVIEVKFWAGLTDNQPVAYLDQLAAGQVGAVIFVVPSLRMPTAWSELIRRCNAAGLQLVPQDHDSVDLKWCMNDGNHALAIVSWRSLLQRMRDRLSPAEELIAADILQLQGLADGMDSDAFLPVQAEELTSNVPRRLVQYVNLVERLAQDAVANGIAAWTSDSKRSGGIESYIPFTLSGFFCYLKFDAPRWARFSRTPFWLQVRGSGEQSGQVIKESLASLFADSPPGAFEVAGTVFVPLDITPNVDESTVLANLREQLRKCQQLLAAEQ